METKLFLLKRFFAGALDKMMQRKFDLQFCKEFAAKKLGECLSEEYTNIDTKLSWKCADGHVFRLSLYRVKNQKKWCPDCVRTKKLFKCQAHAVELGGKCLTTSYSHASKQKMTWICADGHKWKASWASVKSGTWCKVCTKNDPKVTSNRSKSAKKSERIKNFHREGLKKCHETAKKLGGKFLSPSYENKEKKYLWQCSEGHQWSAKFGNIAQGKWCPFCAGRRQTISDLRNYAASKDGKCLSDLYERNDVKYQWQCSEGHKWWSTWSSIKDSGTWCPECSGSFAYLTDDEREERYREICKETHNRGGKVISKRYLGREMTFECLDGHEFKARPDQILKRGTWCKQCNIHFSEKLVRIAFETVFIGYKFPNVRPAFLRSKTGFKLELDGFCPELKLAFEHDGIQHFKVGGRYSNNSSMLSDLKQRDSKKDSLCAGAGIDLLRFSYNENFDELPNLIKSKLPNHRQDLLNFNFNVEPNYGPAYRPVDPLDLFREIAKGKGGRVISKTLQHGDAYIELECKRGHRWSAIAETIKNRGHWCRQCGYLYKKPRHSSVTFEQVKEIRRLHVTGKYSYNKLGEMYGLSGSSISRIVRLKTRVYS